MQTYPIPLVPGPTSVPRPVREAYLTDFGSGDWEPEYAELYLNTQALLQQIMGTHHDMAILSGEGMLALWAALKSCLRPGERVLAISTGVFGAGIGEMARQIGAEVEWVSFDPDAILEPAIVAEAMRRFRPKMVTAVHCETPSGTLNPVALVGELVRQYDVPLFYVDAVSSAGGAPLEVDAWNIDLCLIGSQKCLSAPPNMSVVSVSPRAWQIIEAVGYVGYDALAPWRGAAERRLFPYTPSWHDTAGLHVACERLLQEGLENVLARHAHVASTCRRRSQQLGLRLFPKNEAACSPTITALYVPAGITWVELDAGLRRRGVAVAGSLGPMENNVFRIGHMGSQAEQPLVDRGLDALADVLHAHGLRP